MTTDRESVSRAHPTHKYPPERRGSRRIVSPFRCRVWDQHSRPEEQLADDACKALRDSIAKNGQHQPALGRPVNDEPNCDVEIICGARRHAVARSLSRDLLVEVRDMTDAEAYVAMYEENLLREGDSPYVRGLILSRALRSGAYASQEDIGRSFNLSHSAVSRLLMLAHLPTVIVAAFSSAEEIRESWGVVLHRLWSDETKRAGIASRARAMAPLPSRPRPPAQEVYETLITASGGRPRRRPRAYRNIPIRGTTNAILFHEQDQLEKVMYIIPKAILSPHIRDELKQSIRRILETDYSTAPRSAPRADPLLVPNNLKRNALSELDSKESTA